MTKMMKFLTDLKQVHYPIYFLFLFFYLIYIIKINILKMKMSKKSYKINGGKNKKVTKLAKRKAVLSGRRYKTMKGGTNGPSTTTPQAQPSSAAPQAQPTPAAATPPATTPAQAPPTQAPPTAPTPAQAPPATPQNEIVPTANIKSSGAIPIIFQPTEISPLHRGGYNNENLQKGKKFLINNPLLEILINYGYAYPEDEISALSDNAIMASKQVSKWRFVLSVDVPITTAPASSTTTPPQTSQQTSQQTQKLKTFIMYYKDIQYVANSSQDDITNQKPLTELKFSSVLMTEKMMNQLNSGVPYSYDLVSAIKPPDRGKKKIIIQVRYKRMKFGNNQFERGGNQYANRNVTVSLCQTSEQPPIKVVTGFYLLYPVRQGLFKRRAAQALRADILALEAKLAEAKKRQEISERNGANSNNASLVPGNGAPLKQGNGATGTPVNGSTAAQALELQISTVAGNPRESETDTQTPSSTPPPPLPATSLTKA